MRETSHLPAPRRLSLCIALTLGSLPLAMAPPAMATQVAAAVHDFDLAAGTLDQVLNRFALAAGIELSMAAPLVAGKSSDGLHGRYSVEQALSLLLGGSGLEAVSNGQGQYALRQASGGLSLAPTEISDYRSPGFDPYSTPGPVYHIAREQLERVPYSRPGDIFKDVPGVAAANGTNGAGLELNIRGLQGMGRVKTMVDGTNQSASSYRGYSGNREDNYIDPDLIATIDIKKGPDAGPQGAGVVGGIVNMRTLNASDIIIDPDKNWGLRLRGTHGNNVASDSELCQSSAGLFANSVCIDRDSGHGISRPGNTPYSLGGALPRGNHSLSLAGAWRPLDNLEFTLAHAERESGNYYAGSRGASSWKGLLKEMADKEVPNTSLRSETWLLKSRIGFLDDHSLELGYLKYRSESGLYSSTTGILWGRNWQYGLGDVDSQTYSLRYTWNPDSPWFDLHAGVWKGRLNDSGMVSYPNRTDSLGAELWNASSLELPLGQLNLKYGMSHNQSEADADLPPLTSSTQTTVRTTVLGEQATTGSFFQGEWQVSGWLALNVGVQHDRSRLKDTKSGSPLGSRRFDETSLNYGIVLTPLEPIQLYAQWSEGARPPSLREAFIQAEGVVPNPDLEVEHAKNFEYGVNLHFDGLLTGQDRLGVKFSRFHNRYDDYITRIDRLALGDTSTLGGNYKFANIDKATYKGYELSLDYDIGWSFVSLGLVHYDKIEYCYPERVFVPGVGRVPTPVCSERPNVNDWGGNYVPPRQEKNASLGVRLLERKLVLGARFQGTSKSLYNGASAGRYVNQTIWDNYEIYDLFGSYQATRNLELGFSVENLRDRFYIPSFSNNLDALPAPGRTARATLTLAF